jgi:hypothetical protein
MTSEGAGGLVSGWNRAADCQLNTPGLCSCLCLNVQVYVLVCVTVCDAADRVGNPEQPERRLTTKLLQSLRDWQTFACGIQSHFNLITKQNVLYSIDKCAK